MWVRARARRRLLLVNRLQRQKRAVQQQNHCVKPAQHLKVQLSNPCSPVGSPHPLLPTSLHNPTIPTTCPVRRPHSISAQRHHSHSPRFKCVKPHIKRLNKNDAIRSKLPLTIYAYSFRLSHYLMTRDMTENRRCRVRCLLVDPLVVRQLARTVL